MTDVFRADPGRKPFVGSNAPLDPARCKAGVWSKERWSRYSQCSRKAGKDGWCRQHHPDAETARNAASEQRYEKETRASAMGWFGERMMRALIAIRDGDNNPRDTARAALDGIPYAKEDK